MKKIIILLSAMGIILTSCGTAPDYAAEPAVTAAEPASSAAAEKHYSANGRELNIDMSRFSENAKLLTADDIYLLSYDCGYVSDAEQGIFVIEDQEQLDYALERYSLALPPEGLSDDELWYYNTAISEPFSEMVNEYPISDYSYVVEYDEVNCGGYSLHAGALLVDEEYMFFVMTADSKTPDPDMPQPDVMGGFCYMAAVPKGTFLNDHYKNCVYPDRNDMYQDRDFLYTVSYAAYETTELYDIYGDTKYIIRNEDELNALKSMSEDIKDDYGKPAFQLWHDVDFDNAVMFCEFFASEYEHGAPYSRGMASVEGDTVVMGYEKPGGSRSGFACAVIPKRFLPDKISTEWISPVVGNTAESPENGEDIPGGYIAVFHGGVGERTKETYVYKEEDGYSYINVVSTTVSWGSPRWKHTTDGTGTADTKEEIIRIADDHGADQYVTFPDYEAVYPVEKFIGRAE